MFDDVDWGAFWEWGQPEPESITYFRRIGPDVYQNDPDGVPMRAIRMKPKGQKEEELGLIVAPNYGSDWIIWLDWLDEAALPLPKLEDYFIDAQGVGWTVVEVEIRLRQQVVALKRCCSRN